MKKIIYLFLTVILTSCMSFQEISNGMQKSTIDSIPKGASKIIVENNKSMQDNYTTSYQALLSMDYKIQKSDKEMGYILAENNISGDTRVRLNIICKNGSININIDWGAGSNSMMLAGAMSGLAPVNSTWYKAKWAKNNTKSTTAFVSAVKFAQKLGGTIKYE